MMFCPNCGTGGQSAETYCRKCGTFLPDFEKALAKQTTPRDHFTANTVLSVMTALVSATLAVLLYANFLGKDDTPLLIYVTAGFLTAMFFWQVQVIWRSVLLRREFPERNRAIPNAINEKQAHQLPEADPEIFVGGPSRAKDTSKVPRSPKAEH